MAEKIGDRLLVAGRTNVGRVRTLNEDCFRIDPTANLLVIADGMGGHDAGEVASARVVESVCQSLRQFLMEPSEDQDGEDVLTKRAGYDDVIASSGNLQDDVTLEGMPNPVLTAVLESVAQANTELNLLNRSKGYANEGGMGATVVGLWFPDFSDSPVVFHVGDSRLYLSHGGQIQQVTRDHSLYQQWVSVGAHGSPPPRNVLLQAIGPARHVTPDVGFLQIVPNDVVLLCSDGLTGMVADKRIQQVLQTVSPQNIDEVCDRLITMARDGGGKDNITVIIGCFL